MARKIGTVPTGSVITSRVTKLLARKNVSIIGVGEAGQAEARR
jgi:lactate dehydrogenase-like 2-hydroxyacid dehydrogenase